MSNLVDLQKALDELEDEYPHISLLKIKRVKDEFASFRVEYDNQVHPSRKQLSELDTTQWLIEHEAEIQNHYQRPIIQLSRGQILGYFIDKELLSGSEGTREKLKEISKETPKP